MKLRNDASIAHAVVHLARAFDDVPKIGSTAACVLSRIPGDGAPRTARRIAESLGIEVVVIRGPHLETTLSAGCSTFAKMDAAILSGRPALLLIDEAHGAPDGTLSSIARHANAHGSSQPCLILAISTSAGEAGVAGQLADGMGTAAEDVAMHRTADENLRLVNRVIRNLA